MALMAEFKTANPRLFSDLLVKTLVFLDRASSRRLIPLFCYVWIILISIRPSTETLGKLLGTNFLVDKIENLHHQVCPVCLTNPRDLAFGCGHMLTLTYVLCAACVCFSFAMIIHLDGSRCCRGGSLEQELEDVDAAV
ncbi:hypothetical protein LR48_Vigan10g129100 [Vigna angularis]|uniref:Uncharacterized protein n=1 Tax=Phaseolus angularis TaxID=3914 RepID=A0A0L9VKZ8_PHAAN|nr:hypothetical protein LR48_Vigan10g129100 [Vigna angularis]